MTDEVPTVDGWEVPEYLQNIYAMWLSFSTIIEGIVSTHEAAHGVTEGFEYGGIDWPPDPLVKGLLEKKVDVTGTEEHTFDQLMKAAEYTVGLLIAELTERLQELDGFPPDTFPDGYS